MEINLSFFLNVCTIRCENNWILWKIRLFFKLDKSSVCLLITTIVEKQVMAKVAGKSIASIKF